MWQVFRYEWRTNRRSFFVWAGVIIVFQMMFAGLGDMYTSNTSLLDALRQFPPALLEGFGMHVEMFGSFEGWMAGEPLVFYMMLLGIFAAMWAASTVARERDRGTVDFMFTLPVSRGQLFLGKACAHFLAFLLIAAVSYGVTVWFGHLFSTVEDAGLLLTYSIAGLLASLAFAGIGYVMTVFVTSERTGMSLSIGIVILSFLIHLLSGMEKSLAWMSDISLFTVFNGKDLFDAGSLPWEGVFITIGIYAGGLLFGWLVLTKRDL
ncbi:ABC transporter permease subunit [Paenibacillus alvei]|uniref:ABC transporter permease n=1 Tax=Paenibacillus alvei TaxID=44250 RepID=A0A383R3W5_PAEAL|nr:ABC transporter permease subunit [Paenibacillus alvei]SYX81630.1 ABC transporter permease [Paenibacillus alvei]